MAIMYAAFAPRSKYVVESRVVGIERRQRPGFGGMRSNHVSRQLLGTRESVPDRSDTLSVGCSAA